MHPQFRETWVVDFEFMAPDGEKPDPVCVVAKEVHTGKIIREWLQGVDAPKKPPYPIDEQSLSVAYYASAEWGCHLSLSWDLPQSTIDLYAEYRNLTNGFPGIRRGLLSACSRYGIQTAADAYKEGMRDRILQGPPFTDQEKKDILDYCQSDVDATCELYKAMSPEIDVPRALFRGEYMETIAQMEYRGTPLDGKTLTRLLDKWDDIKALLIKETDSDFGVYEGLKFKMSLFEDYLTRNGIPWPRTEKGNLKTNDDTFKDMAKAYPEIQPLRDLRFIIGQLKLNGIAIGNDNRNRCLLSPYNTKTGRNSPSTKKFIFGPAVWLRNLITPEKGKALGYIDYSQQEFYIAAVLSGDVAMQEAYKSGDPYLAFAKQAGAAPENATKTTHKEIRDAFKQCVLGVQYGMGADSLAYRMGKTPAHAKELLRHHHRVYKTYWDWNSKVFNNTLLNRKITTCLGWSFWVIGAGCKERTIKNWPIQATGAEILRIACILLKREGIHIVAPIHDALLVECYEDEIESIIPLAQKLMEDASEIVLGQGYRIRTDVDLIKWPDRYQDPRGAKTWEKIMGILETLEGDVTWTT
ncbi:DNA polymerase [Methanolobus sp. ZRKC3]|uniref:DNA polymerase n=1 Tax=Methanolobus sp. ZRKC3 TaxID=3125786 RepID=UPI00325603D7